MATPCTHDPNEVIEKVVSAKNNADKFDKFVNGTDTQTVQLGTGNPTPTIRNAVKQIMADAAWAKQYIADAPEGDISLNNAAAMGTSTSRTLAERFGDVVNVLDYGAKGDGTTNDTAAFQAAAATARASFVPAGEYNVPSEVDGKFFSFDLVEAGNTEVDSLYASLRHERLMEVASGLIAPTQIFCDNYFPNHPYRQYYYQSICYDTRRSRFYTGQCDLEDESQAGYIRTFKDITDSSSMVNYANILSGHYNDITYDYKNDKIYVAPGDSANDGNVLYIVNPDLTVAGTWSFNSAIWACEVIGDYLYTRVGDNIVRYNTTTKEKDNSFSISVGDIPVSGDEEATAQSLFFIKDFLAFAGTVHVEDMVGQRRCFFKLYDLKTGESVTCGFSVTNNMEMEGCTVAGDSVYMLFASKFYLSIGVAPVGLFNASRPYPKKISTDGRYADLSKDIEDGSFAINNADAFNALTDAPYTDSPESGTLDVRKIASGEYCEQTITLATGEIIRRIGALGAGREWLPWARLQTFDRIYTVPSSAVSINALLEPGYFCIMNLEDCPGGVAGHVVNLRGRTKGAGIRHQKQLYFRHSESSSVSHEIYIRTGAYSDNSWTWHSWAKLITNHDKFDCNVSPTVTNTYSLGQDGYRWSNVYAYTSTIGTSDERLKDNIAAPSDALMRAWGKVNFKVFQFKDAIAKKGDEARIHVGVIAQQIQAAFASEGLDANKYGLFCYDRWEDEWIEETVIDEAEKLDENGTVVAPEKTHVERKLVREAGDLYSVRYEECLALECAYQRWLGEKRDARIAELEARLNEFSGNAPAPSGASPNNL